MVCIQLYEASVVHALEADSSQHLKFDLVVQVDINIHRSRGLLSHLLRPKWVVLASQQCKKKNISRGIVDTGTFESKKLVSAGLLLLAVLLQFALL